MNVFGNYYETNAINVASDGGTIQGSDEHCNATLHQDGKRLCTAGAKPKTKHQINFSNIPREGAPEGPGWKRLSDNIYVCFDKPFKANERVYNGKQKLGPTWRDIAIKIIRNEEKKFFKEVLLLKNLSTHPNIITIYDCGETTGDTIPHIYIAMELCSQSLREYIDGNKQNPFCFHTAFIFTKQLFHAIAHIHEKNTLHRDLNPENILISPSNDIKLADFGLSKEIKEGQPLPTVSSGAIGSDGYRAPELNACNATATFVSDTFALGIVVHEIFANGNHPYGSDPFRWRQNIMDNKNRDFSKISEFTEPYNHKRGQLLDLLNLCLHHEASSRQTVQNLLKHPFLSDFVHFDKPFPVPPHLARDDRIAELHHERRSGEAQKKKSTYCEGGITGGRLERPDSKSLSGVTPENEATQRAIVKYSEMLNEAMLAKCDIQKMILSKFMNSGAPFSFPFIAESKKPSQIQQDITRLEDKRIKDLEEKFLRSIQSIRTTPDCNHVSPAAVHIHQIRETPLQVRKGICFIYEEREDTSDASYSAHTIRGDDSPEGQVRGSQDAKITVKQKRMEGISKEHSGKGFAEVLKSAYEVLNNGFRVAIISGLDDIKVESENCDFMALHVLSPVDKAKDEKISETFLKLRCSIPRFAMIQRSDLTDKEVDKDYGTSTNIFVVKTNISRFTKKYGEILEQNGNDFDLESLLTITKNAMALEEGDLVIQYHQSTWKHRVYLNADDPVIN